MAKGKHFLLALIRLTIGHSRTKSKFLQKCKKIPSEETEESSKKSVQQFGGERLGGGE